MFTGYDNDVTPEFISAVSPHYGAYVSRRIIDAIRSSEPAPPAPGPQTAPPPPAAPAPKAPLKETMLLRTEVAGNR